MRNIGFIIFFLLINQFVLGQTGTIKGRVFNAASNEPLPFTNIVIWENPSIGSTADLDGNFIFTGLEPGFYRLAATSVGFEKVITEEIQVTNAKVAFTDIPMQEITVQLEQVVIEASPFNRIEESPLSMRTLGVEEIEKNPGGNRDISRVIQALPGVASTPAFRNDIIVRGGGPSENRFYLDGVEIPTINHFATQGASGGPTGIINVDLIREVNFYSGAFPANRGNAMSSVMDLRQRDGNQDKLYVRGTLGASEVALSLDGPIGKKTTFLFSARRSYLQLLFSLIGLPFLPTYNDYQLKVKHRFNEKNELSIVSIGAYDQFKLNTGIKDPSVEQKYILGFLPVNNQWNYTFGAVYKHYASNGYYTLVGSRSMLNNEIYKYENNDESDPDNLIQDYNSQEIENKIRFERLLQLNGYKIVFGAGGEYAKYLNSTYQKLFIVDDIKVLDYNSSLDLFKWSMFGQVSKKIFRERLLVSLGIRMDANSYSNEMNNLLDQFSPRLSLSYYITEKFAINSNIGRFYQLPPYTMLGFRNNDGVLLNKELGLKYISVDHFVAGVEYLPDKRSKITLEGFYKIYGDYPFSVADSISMASKGGDYGVYGDEPVTSTSKGRAYGMELLFRDTDILGFNVILSYTLVRSEFTDIYDKYVPSAWDNKHIFNFTILRGFKGNWQIGAKWRYVGGAPFTPADLDKSSLRDAWDVNGRAYLDYAQFNTERLNSFHQLDLRVDKEFFFDKWSLMLYVDIQNLYNFKYQPPPEWTNLDETGNPNINPDDPTKYILSPLVPESGTVLPTIGIIVEF